MFKKSIKTNVNIPTYYRNVLQKKMKNTYIV